MSETSAKTEAVAKYEAFMERWIAAKKNTVPLVCPHCQSERLTPAPEPRTQAGDVWDSLRQCPDCGELSFVVVNSRKATAHKVPV